MVLNAGQYLFGPLDQGFGNAGKSGHLGMGMLTTVGTLLLIVAGFTFFFLKKQNSITVTLPPMN